MSSDDTTRQLPTEDRLDSLIAIVHQIAADVKGLQARMTGLEDRLTKYQLKSSLTRYKMPIAQSG